MRFDNTPNPAFDRSRNLWVVIFPVGSRRGQRHR